MNIGILGSFFNPPHVGHILVVQQTLEFAHFDEVWFLPGLRSTFNKHLISIEHRLNMIKLVEIAKTQVSALEIDYQLDGNTINLVPILKKLYPKDRFTFIIGSDQLPTFTKWGRWRELLRQLPFLVFPRAGFPLEPLYPGMKVLSHPLLAVTNISSTMVREKIKKGMSVDHFVPQIVLDYIGKHQLYR